jgi:hypothetical protein
MVCFALILLLAIPLHCYVSTTTIFTSTLAFMFCFYVRFALVYLAMSCFYGVAGESGVSGGFCFWEMGLLSSMRCVFGLDITPDEGCTPYDSFSY